MPSPWIELAVLAALGGLFVLFVIVVSNHQRKSFNERFPPISDDEFMARCHPGANREIALKVRRIVAEQLAIEYERIYPASSFVNDLGAD